MTDNSEWPREAGDRNQLPTQIKPPPELQDRVVSELKKRGLIAAKPVVASPRPGWQVMRASLSVAAAAALIAIGIFLGRIAPAPDFALTALTGDETDLYALLLYETAGYDRPDATAAGARYAEYSLWVADAINRGQFVTGEDLEVDRAWLLAPSSDGVTVSSASAAHDGVPLSGIFFVRADNAEHALELARGLPHLVHGGQVVVQKTMPTDVPPPGADNLTPNDR